MRAKLLKELQQQPTSTSAATRSAGSTPVVSRDDADESDLSDDEIGARMLAFARGKGMKV